MRNEFAQKVRDIVRRILRGKTMTYKEVAAKAGNPKAARAVGAIMRANYDESLPCHRVVHSDGSLGHYNRGGEERKREILTEEGFRQYAEAKTSVFGRGSTRVSEY